MNKEITWNIVNAILAALLVCVGSMAAVEEITFKAVVAALFAGAVVAITQFKKYWEGEQGEYNNKTLGSFIV